MRLQADKRRQGSRHPTKSRGSGSLSGAGFEAVGNIGEKTQASEKGVVRSVCGLCPVASLAKTGKEREV